MGGKPTAGSTTNFTENLTKNPTRITLRATNWTTRQARLLVRLLHCSHNWHSWLVLQEHGAKDVDFHLNVSGFYDSVMMFAGGPGEDIPVDDAK